MTNGNDKAFSEIQTVRNEGSLNGQQYVYGNTFSSGGLTKREYFAAMAMQGICACSDGADRSEDWAEDFIAKKSVLISNALINELNKQQ